MTLDSTHDDRSHIPKPLISGWKLTAATLQAVHQHVTVDKGAICCILPWLAPGHVNDAWRGYVGPVDPVSPDLGRLFFELALTISQFGGFIGYAPDGDLDTWKHEGSGVKAILATMASIRAAKKLPGIDIQSGHRQELAHYFIGTTFSKQRLAIMEELGTPQARRFFAHHIAIAQKKDGSYRFNTLHMQGLACRFPQSFGEDPVFYKKASLLLMTMEIALNQLGLRATAETLPPADYRIPQILEGLGILRFSNALSRKLADHHIFRRDDPEIVAIRAMTVEAVGLIRQFYGRHHARDITCAELDGLLYLLSRNRPLMTTTKLRPHMMVATAAF